MNGNGELSELRKEVSSFEDTREVGSGMIEVFVRRLAIALGKRYK